MLYLLFLAMVVVSWRALNLREAEGRRIKVETVEALKEFIKDFPWAVVEESAPSFLTCITERDHIFISPHEDGSISIRSSLGVECFKANPVKAVSILEEILYRALAEEEDDPLPEEEQF